MEQAARLTQYFQSHARKVYASMDADYEAQKATRLLEWIERARRPSFKRWHAFEAVKSAGKFPTPQSLDGALARLAQHGYLRPKSNGLKSGPGRPAAPEFEVNPLILGGDPVIL